jgi:hypothetical protein
MLTCPTDQADARLRQAMSRLDLDPQAGPGTIHGATKRSLRKNRWAAEVAAEISPAAETGSI